MEKLHAAFGLVVMIGLCYALSEARSKVPWKMVGVGLALSFVLAAAMLFVQPVFLALQWLNGGIEALNAATMEGTKFVFGFLGGDKLPFEVKGDGSPFVFAFRALPLVLVVAALSAVLFHWGILPVIVKGFAFVLRRTMGIGGAVGVSAAANVFIGLVESPLVVRPYLSKLSRGELLITMSCGMATVAGSVLVFYASMLAPIVPNALVHLVVASFVATPVAIFVSAIMVPPDMTDDANIRFVKEDPNTMSAFSRGTMEALGLLLNIVAMLVVIIATVALVNIMLGKLPALFGSALTLERIFGWVFAPIAWLIGIPWSEAAVAGQLLGKKTVLNEFIAYLDMSKLAPGTLSQRSSLLMTYALCGFANFGSLGIMLAGMGTLLPERRKELAELGFKSVFIGFMATNITAAIVGVLM